VESGAKKVAATPPLFLPQNIRQALVIPPDVRNLYIFLQKELISNEVGKSKLVLKKSEFNCTIMIKKRHPARMPFF
jgi:hypothetical protein